MAGENGLLTAAGYGTFPIVVTRLSYGLNIIATEEQTATSKYLYTRQVQTDTFSVRILFDTSAKRRAFFNWFQGFAKLAIVPSPVGTMRVQVPGRDFDAFGTPTSGMQEVTTPKDVTWEVDITFRGAFFPGDNAYVNDPSNQIYQAPGDKTANQYFYPTSSANVTAIPLSTESPAQAAAQATSAVVQTVVSGIGDALDWLAKLVGG